MCGYCVVWKILGFYLPHCRLLMRKRFIILAVLMLFWSLFPVFGQRYARAKQYTSIGGSINAMNYFGDITPAQSFASADITFTRYNLGVHIARRYGPRFSARAAFHYGRIKGDDFKSQDPGEDDARFRFIRNASFRNQIYEASVVGMWDFIENRQTYLRRPDFVPYLFAGVAGFYHNPQAKVASESDAPAEYWGKWVNLQPLQTEGKSYSKFQVAIPAGVGFRYKVSPKIDLAFEIGFRYLFTDYLDDVSGNYPDPDALKSDLARAMSNRTLESQSANGQNREPLKQRVLNDLGYEPVNYKGSQGTVTYSAVQGYTWNQETKGEKRGSPNEKDWYLITGFHINYILVKGVRCPKFR